MNCSNITTITGKKPVLLSAPHVYAHRRPKLNMGYKVGERFTDSIVKDVCQKLKCLGIYITEDTDYDANFHTEKSNPYKQEIRTMVTEFKPKLFVDIHGLDNDSMYDFGIYYPSKFSRSRNIAMKMAKELGKGELKGVAVSVFRFPDNGQKTLGEFVASKLRIPAIQIEVARYIREDETLRNSFVENLCSVISKDFV